MNQMKTVLMSPVFTFLTLTVAAGQFVQGGFAFWAPTYLQDDIGVDKVVAGLGLGADVAVAGVLGTLVGGILLDFFTMRAGQAGDVHPGLRCAIGCQLSCAFAICSVPLAFAVAAARHAAVFFTALGFTMAAMFAMIAPSVIAMMECVPGNLRGLAMALNALGIHLLGDLISPVLVGQIADATGSLRQGVWLLSGWTVLGVLFNVIACIPAAQKIGKCGCGRAVEGEPNPA